MKKYLRPLWVEISYYLPSWIRYHYIEFDGHQILWPRWGFTKKELADANKEAEDREKSIKWE